MPRWKVIATETALKFACGCVPISSNFRMLSSRSFAAAIIGQSFAIFSFRT